MRIAPGGIALIKRFEGYRGKAYLCPAGIWTVGYGHTSMAGPPAVGKASRMSRPEAEAALIRDLGEFADGVEAAVRADLTPNQLAALVSFAYNVGLGNFRTSSVLRAVNAGDVEAVPRRLNLWIKAGPRVLPGLVKRRAAEGHLFMTPDGMGLAAAGLPAVTEPERQAMDEARGLIEPLAGKSLAQSTTVISTVIGGLGGLFGYVQEALWQWTSIQDYVPLPPRWLAWSGGLVIVGAAALWIIRERMIKSRDEAL